MAFAKRSFKSAPKSLSDDVTAAYNAMVNLLTRRDYSVYELKQKCDSRYTLQAINQALDLCIERGYQSDERCASMLARHMIFAGYGIAKLRLESKLKGIEWDLVEQEIADFDWIELATNTLMKKYPNLYTLEYEDKRKALAFLARRGFSANESIEALKTAIAQQEEQHQNEQE